MAVGQQTDQISGFFFRSSDRGQFRFLFKPLKVPKYVYDLYDKK